MRFIDEKLLKLTLAAGASALSLGIAAPVLAQQVDEIPDATEANDEDSDEVVVTGSRIRRTQDESIALTEIGSVEIETRGFVNIVEGLEQLPLTGIGSNNTGGNVQFGDNNAFVNLFNLGTNRTLSLINGRRVVGANQGTVFVPGNDSGAQVDLTIVNPALIERTEVRTLTGGAIYGADAVAGVINIILRDDFEGLEVTAQGGLTQFGDGGNYRISGVWGKNFLDGRANLTISGEYLNSDLIRGGGGRDFSADQIAAFNNPLDGTGVDLNPDAPGVQDGITSTVFGGGIVNPTIPTGGLINTLNDFIGGTANEFVPNTALDTAQGANFANFVAQTGLTPLEFSALNPGTNPNLFLGTFGNPGLFPTIANTDPATSAFFPTVAVPLGFAPNGDLVPFSFGAIGAPALADQNSVQGGDGFADPTLLNLRSEQERISFNALWRYDISNNIRYKGNFLFSRIENTSIDGVIANSGFGSPTAGSFGIPVFIDENPFLNDQALGVIDDLVAQGLDVPTITNADGSESRVLFVGRNFSDLTGDNFSGNTSTTFRTEHAIEGEFEFLNREFYWDVAGVYGRNRSANDGGVNFLDVEFALATDVVDVGNGPQCRQQTLAAPEAINIRNPGLSNINPTGLGTSAPSAAQVAACQPLNLFGEGAGSQAAADFFITDDPSENISEQFYAAASFGGEILQLPAGAFSFNSQFEWRREQLDFVPGPVFAGGLARNTLGQPTTGALRFFEGGTELLLPIFGGDFSPFALNRLQFEGAVRVVNRGQSTTAAFADSSAVTDVTFNAGGRYSPFEGITFRGFRSRSVRSSSIVELFGAPQTGFTGGGDGNGNPCDADVIGGGPDDGTREANCIALATAVGIDPATLPGFQSPNAGGIPAATGGNPFLQNEVADNWTVGVVLEPSFIPGLVIESDWFAFDLAQQTGLAFPLFLCFDNPDFPNALVAGTPVCDQNVLNGEDPNNPGQFILPAVNPLNGATLPSPAAVDLVGSPATRAGAPGFGALEFAFIQFPNLNLAATEFRALNSVIRYGFDAGDLFTPLGKWAGFDNLGSNWGRINLSGTVFYVDRFDISANGQFTDTNENAGEPGNSNFQTRLDISHSVGKLRHQLQWFRTHQTVDDVQNDGDDVTGFAELSPLFFNPSVNTFNYNAAYDFTDNITGRLIVNNLTNAQTNANFGLNQGIGRNFIFSIQARF